MDRGQQGRQNIPPSPSLLRPFPPFQFGEVLIVALCDAPMLVFELDFLIEFGLLRDLSSEKKQDKELYFLSHFELVPSGVEVS